MDGQAQGMGFGYDPSVTSVVTSVISRPNPGVQGSFFGDGSSYRTFADTDKIPAVQGDHHRGRAGRGRLLAAVVGVVALVVLLAGAALGLVQAGVIGNKGTTNAGTEAAAGSTPTPSQRASNGTQGGHGGTLLTQTSIGPGAATYNVAVPAYGLTITTGVGRAWVSVGAQGQRPLFAGILQPHSSQHFTMLGAAQVEIGAGGTNLMVTSNHRTQTLQPPSAPFNYTLTTS